MAKPNLFLLPGFHGSSRLFAPLIRELGEDFETHPLGFTSHSALEFHAAALARELPETGAFVLAESFSTLIALKLAAQHPSRFRGLILSTPFARTPFATLAAIGARLPAWCYRQSPLRKIILNHYCLNHIADEKLKAKVLEAINDVPALTVKRRIEVLAATDLTKDLSGIEIPCLLLEASDDRVVSTQKINQLQHLLPNTQLKLIPGPHLILQANPRDSAAAIRLFIDSIAINS